MEEVIGRFVEIQFDDDATTTETKTENRKFYLGRVSDIEITYRTNKSGKHVTLTGKQSVAGRPPPDGATIHKVEHFVEFEDGDDGYINLKEIQEIGRMRWVFKPAKYIVDRIAKFLKDRGEDVPVDIFTSNTASEPQHILAHSNNSSVTDEIHMDIDEEVINDPLLGKGVLLEWLQVNGHKSRVIGTIVKVRIIDGHNTREDNNAGTTVKQYTIQYDKLRDQHTIPESIQVYDDKAWAGCVAYEKWRMTISASSASSASSHTTRTTFLLSNVAPFHISWIVPNTCVRRLVPNNANDKHVNISNPMQYVPHLQMSYQNYLLDFIVKPSTISNAGYGVFLTCRAWDDVDNRHNPKYLELPPGTLLDFGIYAPLTHKDKRRDCESQIKNFIHKFKCEEYLHSTASTTDIASEADENDDDDDDDDNDGSGASNSDDGPRHFLFDITDDITGKLHDEAKKHIPPFVNEIPVPTQIPNVHAIHDVEGSLHYLLGHDKEEHGPFQIQVGKEIEIFVDYGESYEFVRLRQGYPRKKVYDVQQAKLQMKEEELTLLKDVDFYTFEEVKHILGYFIFTIWERKNEISIDIAQRMVLALLLLRKRSQTLYECEKRLGCNKNDIDKHETFTKYTWFINRVVQTFWNNNIDMVHTALRDNDEIYEEFMKRFFEGKDLSSILHATGLHLSE